MDSLWPHEALILGLLCCGAVLVKQAWNWRGVRKMHLVSLFLFPLHLANLLLRHWITPHHIMFLGAYARYEEFTESGLVEPPHVRIGHPIINMDYDKHYVISISLFLELQFPKVVDAGEVSIARVGTRWQSTPPASSSAASLRICHLADIHMGMWMTPARVRSLVEHAVSEHPDLVLITGDMLSADSSCEPDCTTLADVLRPLSVLSGRCFACSGNHDMKEPRRSAVERAYKAAGVTWLRDESTVIDVINAEGIVLKVQLIGIEWGCPRRAVAEFLRTHLPCYDAALRVILLHDTKYFKYVPLEYQALVLSGHTHGGQISLYACGIPLSLVSVVFRNPDNGLFRSLARSLGEASFGNTLFVHPGNGNFDVPMRVLTPAHECTLHVTLPHPSQSGAANRSRTNN